MLRQNRPDARHQQVCFDYDRSASTKFSDNSIMIKDLLDILIIAETKLDDMFPKGQFLIEGFK